MRIEIDGVLHGRSPTGIFGHVLHQRRLVNPQGTVVTEQAREALALQTGKGIPSVEGLARGGAAEQKRLRADVGIRRGEEGVREGIRRGRLGDRSEERAGRRTFFAVVRRGCAWRRTSLANAAIVERSQPALFVNQRLPTAHVQGEAGMKLQIIFKQEQPVGIGSRLGENLPQHLREGIREPMRARRIAPRDRLGKGSTIQMHARALRPIRARPVVQRLEADLNALGAREQMNLRQRHALRFVWLLREGARLALMRLGSKTLRGISLRTRAGLSMTRGTSFAGRTKAWLGSALERISSPDWIV